MELKTGVKRRKPTMYVLRVRQPDDSWTFDMDALMTRREAEYQSKRLRILLGVPSQLWTESEAASIARKGTE